MTAQELLSRVISRYRREAGRNDSIARVLRKLEDPASSLTYADAQRLAGKSGRILGDILMEELAAAFPDGRIPEEIARAVIPKALRQNADLVNRVTREIQRRKNEAAKVPAEPPKAVFRGDRAENLARWAAKQERFVDHGTIFSQYVEQNSRMTVDDAVRDQVKQHRAMGLSPKIIRKAAPGCCDWCTAHAGTVAYGPGMDKEIFRRHKNCPCLIEYDPGTGAKDRQRVENYRFSKDMDPQDIERRKQMALTFDEPVPPKVRELAVMAAQDQDDFSVPDEYDEAFDLPELTLDRQEEETFRELRRLTDETGFEHGAIINEKGEAAFFTDNDSNRVSFNLAALDGEHLRMYHSHTNVTPFSLTDFEALANPRVDEIGVAAHGGYAFRARCYLTERPSVSQIEELAEGVKRRVIEDLLRDPRYYEWEPAERQYMAVYECFRAMAQELGCELEGGALE